MTKSPLDSPITIYPPLMKLFTKDLYVVAMRRKNMVANGNAFFLRNICQYCVKIPSKLFMLPKPEFHLLMVKFITQQESVKT